MSNIIRLGGWMGMGGLESTGGGGGGGGVDAVGNVTY